MTELPASSSPSPGAPSYGQRRSLVVLGTVLAALAAFGSTTQTWLAVTLPQEAVQTPAIAVAGSDAATAVTAFALVALVAALAVSIAGTVARWIIAVLVAVAGGAIAVSSAAVAADPTSAAAPAIGEALGVTGREGVSVSVTAMPWVAVVAGVLLVACAAWIVIAGRRWRAARRYEKSTSRGATPTDQNADEIDSWDTLTRGEDPTR